MARCSLLPGGVSRPIRHRTVDEVWFVLGGRAEVWRAAAGREDFREVRPEDSCALDGVTQHKSDRNAEEHRRLASNAPAKTSPAYSTSPIAVRLIRY